MKTVLGFLQHLILALIWVGVICAGAVLGGERLLGAWTDGQRAIVTAEKQAGALQADKGAANHEAASCAHELTIRTLAQGEIDTMKAAPPRPGAIFDNDQIGKVFGDAK